MEDQIVSISMKTPAWNIVMHALAQRPYGEVAAVIADLQSQASAQLAQAPAQTEE